MEKGSRRQVENEHSVGWNLEFTNLLKSIDGHLDSDDRNNIGTVGDV